MDTRQVYTPQFDTEADPALIEERMRETRARIDRKLDALTARTEQVRYQVPLVVLALASGSAGLALWRRHHRRTQRRRRVIPIRTKSGTR
jgi:hypothetical protein